MLIEAVLAFKVSVLMYYSLAALNSKLEDSPVIASTAREGRPMTEKTRRTSRNEYVVPVY